MNPGYCLYFITHPQNLSTNQSCLPEASSVHMSKIPMKFSTHKCAWIDISFDYLTVDLFSLEFCLGWFTLNKSGRRPSTDKTAFVFKAKRMKGSFLREFFSFVFHDSDALVLRWALFLQSQVYNLVSSFPEKSECFKNDDHFPIYLREFELILPLG